MAAAELASLGAVSQEQSFACVQHLRSCVFSWPLEPSLKPIIDRIDAEFLEVPRPEHFTNFDHCSKCREHDETLRNRTVKTLTRRDLGNQGWNPVTFCDAPGLAYYFPALARFAAIPALSEDQDPYLTLIAPKLGDNRQANAFLQYCTPSQRRAVAALPDWLGETNWRDAFVQPMSVSDFHDGWASWTDGAEVWRSDS